MTDALMTTNPPAATDETAWRAPRPGLRLADGLVLAAVGAVVLLVSLPRLADYARTMNEADARTVLALLAESLEDEDAAVDLARAVRTHEELAHRLRDARPAGTPGRIRFHGYLYAAVPGAGGEPVLLAWPNEAGATGFRAYARVPGRGLLVHANSGARWSGREYPLTRAGADLESEAWRPVSR